MKLTTLLAALLAVFSFLVHSSGSLAASPADGHRPRIGLVLSGGGARGSAHIGVLKVLEELRIPVDLVVGTSMGSLVGGGYASGLSPSELEQRVTGVDWDVLFEDDPPRADWPIRRKERSANPTWDFAVGVHQGRLKLPKGVISGQKVQLYLSDLTQRAERIQSFDDLPIPYRAVATDLENGKMMVFDQGPLPVAMRASMSVPTIFAPLEWEGHLYVDGGLVRNLPVDVARDLGAEVIIAVNLGSGHLPREQLGNILGVFEQMIAILTEQNVQASLGQLDPRRDLLIVPELGDIGSGDFKRAAEAIAIGEAAARRAAPQLARFSVSQAEYAAWQREHRGASQPSERVGDVQVVGLQGAYVNPEVFDGLIEAHQGQPLDRERLVDDIQKVYGHGDFERISYHFKPTLDGHDELIVDAVEKAWGPGYLSFGLGLSNDHRGDNRFGLRATYDRRWVNRLGAEWNTELTVGNAPSLYTELYQPLSLDRTAFVAPYLGMNLNPESVFFKDQRVARYDVTRLRLGADLGTTLRGVELRAGPYLGQTGIALDTGDPELPEGDFRDSGLRGRILYDTLDSAGAPRFGTRVALNLLNPLEALGADLQYSRLSLDLDTARSWGANTVALRLRAGSTFGKELPYYDQFSLGGFLNLSGYANDQLRGNDKLFGSLAYARKIASLAPPIGRGIYLGASLEAGWLSDGVITDPVTGTKVLLSPEETHVGGSLFLGSDTWIGPAYLAVGLTGTGENTIYMLIGRP